MFILRASIQILFSEHIKLIIKDTPPIVHNKAENFEEVWEGQAYIGGLYTGASQ